jgi:RpiR family carbohydrate utilization transcriptional regulator
MVIAASRPAEQEMSVPEPTLLEMRYARMRGRLSERRQKLIEAILDAPHETFYLSSRELARRYEVNAATIVRTVQALGYRRFADFARDLRRHFVERITPYQIMQAATRQHRSLGEHIGLSLEQDLKNLTTLRTWLDVDKLNRLAQSIHRARRIGIVGVDLAASLASFLAYGLTPLGFDAEALIGSEGQLLHKIRLFGARDLLIGISFGRCLRVTVEAVHQASQRGVPTFAITDSDTTPLARFADEYLLAPITSSLYTGSYVAPMGLLNSILVACAHIKPRRSLARLRQTEEEYRMGTRWYHEPQCRSTAPHTGE